MNDPDRSYQYQTSQLLLAIREVHRERAEGQTPLPASAEPMTGDGPPVFSSPEEQRERIVQKRTVAYNGALENVTTNRSVPYFTKYMSKNGPTISVTSTKAHTPTRQRVAPGSLPVSNKTTTTAMIARQDGPTARPWRSA
ncbi:hypothetical protein EJJ20_28030 [Pseudomonas poae]|nr:hypothetical protein EJJ20_28030 [Pseudomonas poae]